MSAPYLDWGKVNFALNGLTAEVVSTEAFFNKKTLPNFRLIRADVFRFLNDAGRERRLWDIIILDPPTFSNSKRMRGTLDIQRDHLNLILQALKLLGRGGKLYFSTNAKRFSLDSELDSSLNGSSFTTARDITEQLRDEDFRGKIPACWVIGNM
jgi:23S rRNA (cytosine1962-C5)-methyltransferase